MGATVADSTLLSLANIVTDGTAEGRDFIRILAKVADEILATTRGRELILGTDLGNNAGRTEVTTWELKSPVASLLGSSILTKVACRRSLC